MASDDLGFIAPEILPGVDAPEAALPVVDPFKQLEAPEEAPTEAEDEEAAEVFESLEDEYRILVSMRGKRDRIKAEHSEASNEYEAQRGRMMRAMTAQGTKQFKSTTVEKGSCHFNSGYGVSITDHSTFIPWVKQHAEELLSVNSRTLTKHVREQFKNRGVPIDDPTFPPGLAVKEHDTLTVSVPKEK
jgi:hypothetical protein